MKGMLHHPFSEEDLSDFDTYNDNVRTKLQRYRRDGDVMIRNILSGQFPDYKTS